MPTINFLAGAGLMPANIPATIAGGSGLGFYGPGGFGASVQVGQWQDNTYITDGTGTQLGPKVDNIKYAAPNSGYLPGETNPRNLLEIPNLLATLQIQFLNNVPVRTQNEQVWIFDRVNINNPASGVTTMVAELRHTNSTVGSGIGQIGSGDTAWYAPGGSGFIKLLSDSPGSGGLRPNGALTQDVEHDWFLAISGSPQSVGAKNQYALFFYLEYL